MKNKKNNFGKIALLTAAMAVTVPSAVILSACGSEEHKASPSWQANSEMHWHNCANNNADNHSFDLANHTWTTIDGEYKCSVCNYTYTKDAKDAYIRNLKAAWDKLAGYQGGATLGSYSTYSYDPETGIGYVSSGSSAEVIVIKRGDRYIEYDRNSYNNNDNFTEVTKEYFEHCVKATDSKYDPSLGNLFEFDLQQIFARGVVNETSFVANGMEYAKTFFKNMSNRFSDIKYKFEHINYEIDTNNSGVTISENDGVVTVVLHVQTKASAEQDNSNDYLSSTITFTMENDALKTVALDAKVVGQNYTRDIASYSQTIGFDQASYDNYLATVGEVPDTIKPKMCDVQVMVTGYQNGGSLSFTQTNVSLPVGTEIDPTDLSAFVDVIKANLAEYCHTTKDAITINGLKIMENVLEESRVLGEKYTVYTYNSDLYFATVVNILTNCKEPVECKIKDDTYGFRGYEISDLYGTPVNTSNIDNYSDQLAAAIAEDLGVDAAKIKIRWTFEDFKTNYYGSFNFGTLTGYLYAYAVIGDDEGGETPVTSHVPQVGDNYVCDKVVEFKNVPDEQKVMFEQNLKSTEINIISETEVSVNMGQSMNMQYTIADGKITITTSEGAVFSVFTIEGDTFTGEISMGGEVSAVITYILSK